MWNKSDTASTAESIGSPASGEAAPAAPLAAKIISMEGSASKFLVGRQMEGEARGVARIGRAVKIVGQIYSREDLIVDGDLEGTIEAVEHKVTVGPNGDVHAAVKARDVVAMGTIKGDVEAKDSIEIRKNAKLMGDIKTGRIIVEDGAYLKCSIDIVKRSK